MQIAIITTTDARAPRPQMEKAAQKDPLVTIIRERKPSAYSGYEN